MKLFFFQNFKSRMNRCSIRFFNFAFNLSRLKHRNGLRFASDPFFHHESNQQTLSLSFQSRNYAKKAGKMNKGGKVKIFHISEQELSDVISVDDYRSQLLEVKTKLIKDFTEHLSLRSSSSNIDNLQVEIAGEKYPLHEVAQISKKNPNLVAINMSDFPDGLKPAIAAIIESGSGLNPQQEGTMIYLPIPKMTREHRESLSKNAKNLFTKAKDDVRDIQNAFSKLAKSKTDLSEDLIFGATTQIKTISEKTVEELEKILKTKQKDLLGDN